MFFRFFFVQTSLLDFHLIPSSILFYKLFQELGIPRGLSTGNSPRNSCREFDQKLQITPRIPPKEFCTNTCWGLFQDFLLLISTATPSQDSTGSFLWRFLEEVLLGIQTLHLMIFLFHGYLLRMLPRMHFVDSIIFLYGLHTSV